MFLHRKKRFKEDWLCSYQQDQDHGTLVDVVRINSRPLPKPAPVNQRAQSVLHHLHPLGLFYNRTFSLLVVVVKLP